MMSSSPPDDALRRDLALVLPTVRTLSADETWIIPGESIARIAEALGRAVSPAFRGLEQLSIEAVRAAVALAEHIRGKLLWSTPPLPRAEVTQAATLGHVLAAEMILWVGRDTYDENHPVAQAIAQRRLLASFVDATLDAVLKLRDDFQPAKTRVAAVLPPGCDRRVVSQWHKLAAQVQDRVRLSVLSVPDLNLPNARGAAEVVTWLTGLSLPASGGIDFADGAPRPCAPQPGDLEVVFEPRRVRVGDVTFDTPGLAIGLAGRVMRCDGVVLWLCHSPGKAVPDPMVELLSKLQGAL